MGLEDNAKEWNELSKWQSLVRGQWVRGGQQGESRGNDQRGTVLGIKEEYSSVSILGIH